MIRVHSWKPKDNAVLDQSVGFRRARRHLQGAGGPLHREPLDPQQGDC